MKLRVATYNIHKGVSGGLRQRVRIHDVRVALQSIDADIVFLQEVQDRNERLVGKTDYPDGTQLEFLCSPGYAHRAYGMNAVYPHGHHGNAILSRHSIAHVLNHDISDHALEKRGLLHAVVHLPRRRGKPHDLHLINVHLGLIKQSRVRQARFIIDFVRNEVPADAPLIIAGDFNDWQRRVDALLQQELGLRDAAAEFNDGREPSALVRLLPFLAPRRERVAKTFPSVLPWFTLDRIYLRRFSIGAVEVPRGGGWARVSDHVPLIADVELS